MWVCSCRGITDRAICSAIERGARTLEDVVLQSGAGLRCQSCRPILEELLRDAGTSASTRATSAA
jgi:bacterioferritin-associated ferredoxin